VAGPFDGSDPLPHEDARRIQAFEQGGVERVLGADGFAGDGLAGPSPMGCVRSLGVLSAMPRAAPDALDFFPENQLKTDICFFPKKITRNRCVHALKKAGGFPTWRL
ncbi:MAG: hypothetical protein WCH44_11080, partial [Betaproteobacteria bacterium]